MQDLMRPLAITLVTILAGCGGNRSSSRAATAPSTSGAPVTSSSAPIAAWRSIGGLPLSPTPRVSGSPIELGYTLSDAQGDLASVRVELSLDGRTWSPATRATALGDATTQLGTQPGGVDYVFAWDAVADLGPALARVRLRVTPSDAAVGAPVEGVALVDLAVGAGPGVPTPTPPSTPTPAPPPASPAPTNPSPAPGALVNQVIPSLGARGRTVRVRGSGFASSLTDNVVTFGGVAGQVVLARPDELVVATPTRVPLGSSPVEVTVRGVPATPTHRFRFLADPRLLSVTPAQAAPGDLITLTGSDLDTVNDGVVVRFSGGVSVIATARGAGLVQVTVPAGAQTGSIYVVTHGARSNSLPFGIVTPTPPPSAPAPPTGTPPVVTQVGAPAGTARDAVPLPLTVRDAEGDVVTLEVEHQLGFAPWQPATRHRTSDPLRVTAPAGGATYRFVWDSTADVGVTSGPLTARLRVRATDGAGASPWVVSAAFALANTSAPAPPSGGGNAPPDIHSVGTPTSPQGALVTLPYTVADAEGDRVSVEVRYMLSAITGWQTCTLHPTSDPVTNVATSAAGRSYRFVWDARADLGFVLTSAVIVQVRARDAVLGPGRTTGSFRIDTR